MNKFLYHTCLEDTEKVYQNHKNKIFHVCLDFTNTIIRHQNGTHGNTDILTYILVLFSPGFELCFDAAAELTPHILMRLGEDKKNSN